MVLANKPDSVTVVVVNRKTKKSRSFTVYGSEAEFDDILAEMLTDETVRKVMKDGKDEKIQEFWELNE